jgi:hypothetical protein
MAVTDNHTECGSLPVSFYQLLASCIVGYDGHYRLNLSELSGDCADLHDLESCGTSHIDTERKLAENVFAVDECDRLTLKVFVNSSDLASDYGICAELPQTFLEMLAKCVVGYDDIAGVRHYWLNTITFTGYCDDMTPLLDCDTNAIEAERLLVANIFGVDSCDFPAIKIIHNLGAEDPGSVTDYTTGCEEEPQSFLQLLARCIVLYGDVYKLNTIEVETNCDDLTDFWTCNNNHIDPERALCENVFAIDECGNLALKIFTNTGER